MADEELVEKGRERLGIGTVAGATALAVALVAFVVQNTEDTRMQWLFVDRTAPLWVVIVIAAVAGAVLSEVLGWVIRRRRRR